MAAWQGGTLERKRQWAGFKPVFIGLGSGRMFEIGAAHAQYVLLKIPLLQGNRAHWGPFKQATLCRFW